MLPDRMSKHFQTHCHQSTFFFFFFAARVKRRDSGLVWKQDVGRRAGHRGHGMEPPGLICIGLVCVCLFCTSVSNEILVLIVNVLRCLLRVCACDCLQMLGSCPCSVCVHVFVRRHVYSLPDFLRRLLFPAQHHAWHPRWHCSGPTLEKTARQSVCLPKSVISPTMPFSV